MKTENQLKVEIPCPSLLIRMNKEGNDYFCKSCSKTVIDFRDKSTEDIASTMKEGICGVFTSEQLTGQPTFSFGRQVRFYLMTTLAFIGFTVKPLSAQVPDTTKVESKTIKINSKIKNNDTLQMGQSPVEKPKQRKEMKRKKKQAHKKRKHRVIGTPSF